MTPTRRAFLSGNIAPAVAAIGATCLARRGIACGSCADVCQEAAIRLRPRAGGPPLATLAADLCTGCGECQQVCPVEAISMPGLPHA
ncbi:MAG: 4Fe-4S binding protein [Gemmobacter sp.]|nr:4Fe-4S binding protein [Gemmobacter sp.]